jgi:hypothetical protein
LFNVLPNTSATSSKLRKAAPKEKIRKNEPVGGYMYVQSMVDLIACSNFPAKFEASLTLPGASKENTTNLRRTCKVSGLKFDLFVF